LPVAQVLSKDSRVDVTLAGNNRYGMNCA